MIFYDSIRYRIVHQSPLLTAIVKGNVEVAENLVKAGADVMMNNSKGSVPLAAAAYRNQTSVLKILIEKGAEVNHMARIHGDSALRLAVAGGHPEAVRVLLQAGANPSLKDENARENSLLGRTPLDQAQRLKDPQIKAEIIKLLNDALQKKTGQTQDAVQEQKKHADILKEKEKPKGFVPLLAKQHEQRIERERKSADSQKPKKPGPHPTKK